MSEKKTALIAGSSGLVGRELLLLLLENPKYGKVIALVRKKSSYQHAKLVQVEVDFNKLDDAAGHFKNVTDLFCCLGTTMKNAGSKEAFKRVDLEYPISLAELATKNNCSGFYCISAMGANSKSRAFYNRVKGELEETVSRKKIPSIYFFRPSLLLGYREEFRLGERIAIAFFRVLAFIFWGPLKNLKGIPAKKVAAAMMNAADHRKAGKHFILSGSMQ